MKDNIKKTFKNGPQANPKLTAALVAAAVTSGTVGTAPALASVKAATLGFIVFPH